MKLWPAFLALFTACTSPATEILVHIQSDLQPDELDTYTLRVRSEVTNEVRSFERAAAPLPASFSVSPKDDQLERRVTIAAQGLLEGRSILTATIAFDRYTAKETRHVCIFLLSECAGKVCPGGQSCGPDGCAPYVVDPSATTDERCVDPIPPKPVIWWNQNWAYRIDVFLDTRDQRRRDYPVELEIDFAELLSEAGVADSFDPASPRVVEHQILSGEIIGETPAWFHHGPGEGKGLLIFSLRGETPADTTRRFSVYFDAGTAHVAPAAWLDSFTDQIGNGAFALESIARQGGAQLGIGAAVSDFSPNTTEFEGFFFRATKIRSNTYDHGTRFLGEIAAQRYPEEGAKLRLEQDDLKIVESKVDLPPLTIRELTIISRGSWARIYTRFENRGPDELSGLRYFEAVDFDLGDSQLQGRDNNTAAHDPALDMLYAHEHQGRPNVVALAAQETPAAFSAHDSPTVFLSLYDNGLNNNSRVEDQDIAVAFEYSVPAVPAQRARGLKTALISRENLAAASADAAMLRSRLGERRSKLIRRPQ